jgi:hypothetical protein
MALVISDRVKETTVTTGTGTITLGGAVSGFRTFASVLSNNDTTYYAIVGSNEFEVGIGTFSGSTLTRDTVFSSSNSNAKVDFAAGTKNIFITQPASKAVYKDENDTIDINTDNVTEGSTNLYFTNERVDDRVGSLLVAGDNVTLAYDDAAGTLTISATEDNLSNNDTDDLAEGSTNLYYTDTRFDTRLATKDTDDVSEGTTNLYHTTERVQDVVGGQFITNGTHTGISFSYDDFTDGAIDATVSLSPFSTSNLSEGTNLYYTTARFDSAFSGKSTSDLSEGTNLYYTTARFDSAFSGKSTSDLSEGTNLYYTTARFDSAFSGKDTDDLTEGTTNLYHTDERVDDRVSNLIQNGTGISFAYNDSLGTLTPTVSLSAFDTDNLSEGSTNLYYTDTRANSAIDARVTQSFVNALNVTAAGVQANSVALGTDTTGNYIATIAGTANKISVTGSGSESAAVTLTLPDDVQIANDLTVAGDLTVNGATTTLGTTNLEVSDNLFELNSGLTTAPVNDSGMLIQRGTSDNAVFMWDESVDKFTLGTTTATAASTGNITITTGSLVANLEGNVTGNVTGTVSSLSNHDTGDLAEGSNLYHTNERVQDLVGGQFVTNGTHTGISFAYDDAGDGAIDATVSLASFSTSDLSEGTNLYYTDARFDTRLASKSTSDLSEGTNLYYTDTRFDTRLATKSTSDLSEGTNLYYTDARVETYLDGGTSTPTFASATVSGDLTVDTDTLYVDSAGSEVGVGTTSPAAKLHVQVGSGTTPTLNSSTRAVIQRNAFGGDDCGIALISGNNASTGAFIDFGDADDVDDGKIHYATNNRFMAFHTAASEKVRIDSSGNVGIGTSSPSHKLDVVAGSGDNFPVEFNGDSGVSGFLYSDSGGAGMFNGSPVAGSEGIYLQSTTGFASFYTNGSEQMRIDSSGNVGIGTTSPAVPFHVSSNNGAIARFANNSATDTTSYINVINANDTSNGTVVAHLSDNSSYIGNQQNSHLALVTNDTERMRIDSSGNVGIGETSPSSYGKFAVTAAGIGNHINSTSGAGGINFYEGGSGRFSLRTLNGSAGLAFYDTFNGAERMRIDSSGALLVGATSNTSRGGSATKQLIKFGSGQEYLDLQSNNTTTNTAILFSDGSTGSYGAIRYRHNGDSLEFMTASTERMRIDSSGFLTVGNTSALSVGVIGSKFNGSIHNGIVVETTRDATGSTFIRFNDSDSAAIGSIYQNGASTVLYATSSDYRLKENVIYDWTALDRLNQLKPARFNFIADADTTVDGFLAHEVQDIVPEAIMGIHNEIEVWKEDEELPEGVNVGDNKTDEDGNTIPVYQGIDQSKLVPLLVKAVQELSAKVETLEAQLQGN